MTPVCGCLLPSSSFFIHIDTRKKETATEAAPPSGLHITVEKPQQSRVIMAFLEDRKATPPDDDVLYFGLFSNPFFLRLVLLLIINIIA